MKESPGRYINPFLSDEENERLNLWDKEFEHTNNEHGKVNLWNEELEPLKIEHDKVNLWNEEVEDAKIENDKVNLWNEELEPLKIEHDKVNLWNEEVEHSKIEPEKVNLWNEELEHKKVNLWDEELEQSKIEHSKLRDCLGQSEFCEKEAELYTDKNVMECELPEFLICYKEGAFHVKDICVDEGIPHGEKFLFDENNNEMLNLEPLRYSTVEDHYMESNLCSGIDANVDTHLPVLESSVDQMSIADIRDKVTEKKSDLFSGTEEVDVDLPVSGPIDDTDTQIPAEDLQNLVPDSKECECKEEVIDSSGPNELKVISEDDSNDGNDISKFSPEGFIFSSETVTVSKPTDNNGPDISAQSGEEKINASDGLLDLDNVSTEKVISSSGPCLEQDRILPSLQSLIESIEQQPCQSHVEEVLKKPDESENNTLYLNSPKPATASENAHSIEDLEHVDELFVEPYAAPKLHDIGSDKVATLNPILNRGEGESSFSVVGTGSEITYSGPIGFSGNTSLRSDSSTTSTRSFAFPILQNEWNSSPVRMAKADRRRLQKHRGWRNGLLCCRF